MSFTGQDAIDKKEGRVMHGGITQGKAILAGFVIAGALVLALPLPSQAQENRNWRGASSALDPHYMDNKRDLQLKMDVKWALGMNPWIDIDHIHILVRDGAVTLRGVVEDSSAVDEATRIATDAGAKKVINLLTTEQKR